MKKSLLNIPSLLLLLIVSSVTALTTPPDSIVGTASEFTMNDGISGKNDFIGGRSKLSITIVIIEKLSEFKRIYTLRLLEKPGLEGEIDFKFGIDESGRVPFCTVAGSTMNDGTLENQFADFIKNWRFDKIDKPGDVFEVTYPFYFSPGSRPDTAGGTAAVHLMGGRSKGSIARVVTARLSELKKAYNARLSDKPGLGGRIIFIFAVNDLGSVIYCTVDRSTVNDEVLEKQLAGLINNWKFDKIDKSGDITKVTYPFVFTPGGKPGNGVLLIAAAVLLSLGLLTVFLIH